MLNRSKHNNGDNIMLNIMRGSIGRKYIMKKKKTPPDRRRRNHLIDCARSNKTCNTVFPVDYHIIMYTIIRRYLPVYVYYELGVSSSSMRSLIGRRRRRGRQRVKTFERKKMKK